MRFPHAHGGVKKLFIGEILQIIAAVLGIVVAVLGAIALAQESEAFAGAVTGVGIAALVLVVVGAVIQFIGFIQAGKDDGNFRVALWCIILVMILSVVTTILESVNKDLNVLVAVLDAVSNVAKVFVTIYMLYGIMSLAGKLGEGAMARRGNFLVWAVVILFVVTTALSLFGKFIPVVAGGLAIGASVVETIIYVLTVIYLGSATKMLRK